MSRDIAGKLASGEKLTEDEVAYASDRGISLPEEYGEKVRTYQMQRELGATPSPVFQGGGAFGMGTMESSGPGVFLSEEELGTLTKDTLAAIGDAKGVELGGSKAEMLSDLVGGSSSSGSEDEEG
jgi:hypothetical protein